ncbi:LysR family transcriptional regulator [Xenorhabdus sp. DI]|uniref:LysR family transcriptional regulator n=1 Tax=Xenorhabdus doucetiae TaxID=351671 RepID=UPI001989BB6E|nr:MULTISPECIES: LysR family transcriptional regulator [unclassified Xenorhabdus]MBD2784937.1 LysR family transcriptional regulator [Xenorhabdus sp. 3]MBD2789214.1 LysR family transcriptional regulator [Xenorhabdus sp. DI]
MNNLRNIDLNLLVTLQVLLIEKHITRTANRLHKSQPAISHALANLRNLFNDPLLVRHSGKLELTTRAQELLIPLREILGQIHTLIEPPLFDPTQTKKTFRLSMSDYGARVLLPTLIRTFRIIAPNIELSISQTSRESMLVDVVDSEIDLAFGVFPHKMPEDLRTHTLFSEKFSCLADASTIPRNGYLDRNSWLARPHVSVAMRAGVEDDIDRVLLKEGLHRQIRIQLPHWGIAHDIISGTDLILTVAHRSLISVENDSSLQIFTPPFDIAPFDFKMVWHKRREIDTSHCWLRQIIMRLVNNN